MNERIQELAMKTNSHLDNSFDLNYKELDVFLSKFAQLIVRECAETIQDFVDHRFPASEYPNRLKKYFGVEERKGWVCPKCGVDRTQEACPKGHTAAITGDCPMTATAQLGVEE